MGTYKSLDSLLKQIKKDVIEIMQTKDIVEDAIGQSFSNAVKNEVYSTYVPKTYMRRKDNGGLSDKRNVKLRKSPKNSSGNIFNFEYMNMTIANDGQDFILGALVEYGDSAFYSNPYGLEYNWKRSNDYLKPRPFDKEALEFVKQSASLPKVLKRKLNEKGYSVK